MGVATGITMEFQFGTNWAYYSHYVGDIFGAPLAIEGLMAFFLESTFVGLPTSPIRWDRPATILKKGMPTARGMRLRCLRTSSTHSGRFPRQASNFLNF